MLVFLTPLMTAAIALQGPPPAGIDETMIQWPDESALADGFGADLAKGAEGCVVRAENREKAAEVLRRAGLALSDRSRHDEKSFTLYTRPERRFDRLIYHYFRVGEAICPKGPCLSSYGARIELPVDSSGRSLPARALNDPDRTTLALFEAAEAIADRCGRAE
jgi:hypothetical protein